MQTIDMETPPQLELSDLFRPARRARVACQACRAKKIRCDAKDGEPCSNCLLENVQCVLVPKKPRRYDPTSSPAYFPELKTGDG